MSLLSDSPNDRVMAFIDLANIQKSNSIPGFPVDLYSVCRELVGNRRLIAAYVFDARPSDGSQDLHEKLHNRLRMIGFRVIARESYNPEKNEQKEVDVAMACEMVVQAMRDNYDVALVVSGDRDFVPAIQHVQAAGKRVEVAAFRDAFSNEMKKMCDYYHELDSLPLISVNTYLKTETYPEGEDRDGESARTPEAGHNRRRHPRGRRRTAGEEHRRHQVQGPQRHPPRRIPR